jgi:hypothetical protein
VAAAMEGVGGEWEEQQWSDHRRRRQPRGNPRRVAPCVASLMGSWAHYKDIHSQLCYSNNH